MSNDEELKELYDAIIETDGGEFPATLLGELRELENRGLITLSGAHGPSQQWYRAELVTTPKPFVTKGEIRHG